MPKQLNVEPNERIDLVDFDRASKDYTSEEQAFIRRKIIQARRALFIEGFRVELADQSANPGQITIYNGNALARNGSHLNNEDQVNTARTITLTGASTTFFVEVEFTSSESDIDARAFIDPTFVNTGTIPPGREFSLNTATRITPDWQLISPVSTTDFEVNTNANSTRIPLIALTTNASNEITTAVNTGLVEVVASSTLEDDAALNDTTIRLVDTRIFPDTGVCTVDFGGTTPQTGVNITANDRTNGILTISPALNANREAGAIVRVTGVTPRFVREQPVGAPVSGHPDRRRRLFSGDEVRGSGLIKSKETFGDRDDVDLRNLKDYIDFVAATIREMKFGQPRTDTVLGQLPPDSAADWTPGRWFSPGGHIQGARTASITIGDATDSLGDLNETGSITDLAVLLQQAHDSLPATRGGKILVRKGVYEWSSTFSVDRPIELEFEADTALTGAVATLIDITNLVRVTVRNMRVGAFTGTGENRILVSNAAGATVNLFDCDIGNFDASAVTTTGGLVIHFECCNFTARNSTDVLLFRATGNALALTDVRANIIKNCVLTQSDATNGHINGGIRNLLVENCHFEAGIFFIDVDSASITVERVAFRDCVFESTVAQDPIDIDVINVDGLVFDKCRFTDVTVATVGTLQALIRINATTAGAGKLLITDCDFEDTGFTFANSDANRGRYIYITDALSECVIQNCVFGSQTGVDANGSQFRVPIEFTGSSGDLTRCVVRNNAFREFYRGVVVNSTISPIPPVERLYILENDFFRDVAPGPTSIVGILVSAGDANSVIIANNRFSIEQQATCISVVGPAVSTVSPTLIVNNIIEEVGAGTSGSTTDAFGISIETGGNYIVSGNTINNVKTDDGQMYSIYFSTGAERLNAVVSNNVITSSSTNDAGGGSSNKAAIYVANTSADNKVQIAANVIDMAYDANLDSTVYTCIDVQADNIVVLGNHIKADVSGPAPAATSTSAMIRVNGNDVKVVDNYLEGEDEVNVSILLTGTVSKIDVVGNYIIGGGDQNKALISTDPGSTPALSDVKITNNFLILNSTSGANDGINVITASGSQLNVSNNQVQEDVFVAGRQAIVLNGTVGALKFIGLQCSNNVMYGSATSATANRTGGATLEVVDYQDARVADNIVVGWFDVEGTDGTAIEIDASDIVYVSGNLLEPGDGSLGAGNETIRVVNCDVVLYDSNIAVGLTALSVIVAGTSSTLGTTNLTTGTNKFS